MCPYGVADNWVCLYSTLCVLSICMCILHIVFCIVCKYVLSICKLLLFFCTVWSTVNAPVQLFCTVCPYVNCLLFFCTVCPSVNCLFFCTVCPYVNCCCCFFFCTVWSTLIRISLTKALVLWWCDNKSDLIWFDLKWSIYWTKDECLCDPSFTIKLMFVLQKNHSQIMLEKGNVTMIYLYYR